MDNALTGCYFLSGFVDWADVEAWYPA